MNPILLSPTRRLAAAVPALALAALAAVQTVAAQGVPPEAPPRPVPGLPDPAGRPLPDRAAPVQPFEGTVAGYLVNEFGEVDGFVAKDGTSVRFPPHMGADLVATLKPGDAFVAQGAPEAWGRFRAFSLGKRGTQTVLNESRPSQAPRPPEPPAEREARLAPMQRDGVAATVVHAPRGEVEAVVMQDGTTIRLPPGTVAPLHRGSRVQVRGVGTIGPYGTGVRADALTVDGQVVAVAPPRAQARPGAFPPPVAQAPAGPQS